MTRKEFGFVTVWTTEKGESFICPKGEVQINWGCIGSVPIERAEEFAKDMLSAICFAKAERERINR